MTKINQIKAADQFSNSKQLASDINTKVRLNLYDLLKRRKEEKKVDKKTNLIILSGVMVLATVVVTILSL